MTTATAPTTIKQQIQERIEALVREDGMRPYDRWCETFGSALHELYGTIDYDTNSENPDDDEDSIWTDLRPTQQKRLQELVNGLYRIEDQMWRLMVDAVVEAGETFAAEYPDALRVRSAGPS